MNCSELVRGPKTGLRRPCPGVLNESGECSARQYHLWVAKSGWCSTKACEGKKPIVNGVPQKTCRLWQKCPCKCHDNISKLLAPKKQQRAAFPDAYEPKKPFIYEWMKKYDARHRLLNNPELRVHAICQEWYAGDRAKVCTGQYVVSQTQEEKPLSVPEVEKIFRTWLTKKSAFVGGEPLRFIKFL